jgi:hypothetical protein
MASKSLPIGIYYEHPDWFRPLFAELERRAIPFLKIDARRRRYDPSASELEYSLVFNRMSPSAYLRGHGQGIFYALNFLAHLERLNVPIVNGRRPFMIETSKALQLSLLELLGSPYPRTHVINHPLEALPAARRLRFPVVVKANIGGSGAGIARYDTLDALTRAVADEKVELGIDQTALVQEFIPARGGRITRVETLNRRFLYAINVYSAGESFNLCPADICQTTDGVELNRAACPADAPKTGLRVEACAPPPEVVEDVESIASAAEIDVGGIEYIIDDRDGRCSITTLTRFRILSPMRRASSASPRARGWWITWRGGRDRCGSVIGSTCSAVGCATSRMRRVGSMSIAWRSAAKSSGTS